MSLPFSVWHRNQERSCLWMQIRVRYGIDDKCVSVYAIILSLHQLKAQSCILVLSVSVSLSHLNVFKTEKQSNIHGHHTPVREVLHP